VTETRIVAQALLEADGKFTWQAGFAELFEALEIIDVPVIFRLAQKSTLAVDR
jgi:hypothetical protein